MASCEHPSADMIYEALHTEMSNLSLGTVYRNLGQLERAGKIQMVATVAGKERYDARCDCHAHFVCKKCGAVMDLDEIDIAETRRICGAERFPAVERVSVVFEGVCDSCEGMKPEPIEQNNTANIFKVKE